MNAPLPNTGGAVDLAQVRALVEEQDREASAEARAEALANIREHDRRMQRIFKGIIPRPVRRRMMAEALARMADEQ